MSNDNYEAFVQAYNNFDYRPLKGESMRRFYVDDFTKDVTNSIIKTIQITERFRKILIIGHTGCGKSTILNKVAEELKEKYHIVSFSIAEELNLMDVEVIDILMIIYVQLVYSVKGQGIEPLFKQFEEMIDPVRNKLKIKEIEAGISLLKTISLKVKVEPEARETIRNVFKSQAEILQENISKICEAVYNQFILKEQSLIKLGEEGVPEEIINKMRELKDERYISEGYFLHKLEKKIGKDGISEYKMLILNHSRIQKDVLIIIDDLDKLKNEFAEKIFFEETHLVTILESKIIFTFPLATYYSPSFIHITDKFTSEFIQLVNLYDIENNYQEFSLTMLKKLVLKRISKRLISDEALKYVIDKSGGLLRDLIKFMQDACKIVIDRELLKIDEDVSKRMVQGKINEYNRLFDFKKYENDVKEIIKTHNKDEVEYDHLIDLLRYLFILEYGREGEQSWYDAHPCLKECFERKNQ